ncbi:MAG: ABC transporter ATP-binding protein [Cyanobacteriota bacterium]|nr:ABC transporter ATP-binding protein [Cyanobacteriota bacterium]
MGSEPQPLGPSPEVSVASPRLRLHDLWHRYSGMSGDQWTLRGLSLSLGQGELVGLLGPSGCGKTTLLRLIAGFERPDRGVVELDGREVAGGRHWLAPEARGVGMVFQDYALFPHLDAWANACFGLRRRRGRPGAGTAAQRERVAWLLELMGLGGLERRYPHELSGGQRQRLALARALAPGPSLVLLDEPFSNLDVEVRLRLRSELPEVLSRCGASGLLITHDAEEAMAICDRVAVMRAGELHQCGPPQELTTQPATPFVGRFVMQANSLPARLEGPVAHTAAGALELLEPTGPMELLEPRSDIALKDLALKGTGPEGTGPEGVASEGGGQEEEGGGPVVLVLPEGLDFHPDPNGEAWVLGREFLGQDWAYWVQWGSERLRLRLPLAQCHGRGERGVVRLRARGGGWLFPGGQRLRACPTTEPR